MEQIKNLNLLDIITLIIIIILLWQFAPNLINAIFNTGKEFGEALAKWF